METASREPADRSNAAWDFLVKWLPPTACVAAMALAAYPAYLPTVDGPQQLYYLHILHHWNQLSAWYEWQLAVGALGYPLLLVPLGVVLPWTVAYKISLVLVVGLWCSAVWGLARALEPRRLLVVAGGAVLAFQWSLYMGFLSFLVGTSLGIWAIARTIATESKPRSWEVPSLLLLSIVGHAFGGLLCFCVVAAVRAIAPQRASTRLKRAALDLGPALVTLVIFSAGHRVEVGSDSTLFLPWADRFLGLGRMMAGGPGWRCLPPFAATLAGAGAVLWAWNHGRGRRVERVLAIATLTLIAAALLAPLHMPGWMHLSPRFLPLATILGLVLIPIERIQLRWAPAVLIPWAAASMAWTAHWHARLGSETRPVLEAAQAPIHRRTFRLPILGKDPWGPSTVSMGSEYPYFDPLFNISLLMSLEQGGLQPYTFTMLRGVHLFVGRRETPKAPRVPDRDHYWLGLLDTGVVNKPGLRESLLIDLASAGSKYEDVILLGEQGDGAMLEKLGYVADWDKDGVWIGRFVGCPARLRLEVPPEAPKTWALEYGWFPMMQPFWSTRVERPDHEPWVVELPGSPCGPIWVRVAADQGGWSCAGAGENGLLGFLKRTREVGLRCKLTRP